MRMICVSFMRGTWGYFAELEGTLKIQICQDMPFTKSFGYALRAILYLAMVRSERPKVQVEEIAAELEVPRHFLGKIMKKVVKSGILHSTRGPYGGFSLHDDTLSTPLFQLAAATNSLTNFDECVLRLKKCDADHPCPLHHKMLSHQTNLHALFANTCIGDLLNMDQPDIANTAC